LKNDSAAFEDGVIASPGRKDEWYRWPERVLTYEFHSSISFDNRNKIKNALQGLEDKLDSCVKFSEANSGPRVVIFDDTNCYSVVGYQHRVQGLSLGSRGCMSNSTIEHEFLHALGVWHTQSRTDRDSYVKILEDNIRPDRLNNFEIADKNEASEFDLPYDYYSVMHYGAYDFSNHKPDEPWKITIETLDETKQEIIGTADGVSEGDIKLLKKMYKCDEATATTSTTTTTTTTTTNATTTTKITTTGTTGRTATTATTATITTNATTTAKTATTATSATTATATTNTTTATSAAATTTTKTIGTRLPPSDCTSKGKKIISLLNAYRAEHGLPSIPKSCALCTVANEKVVSGDGHSWTGRFACNFEGNPDCMWKKPSELTGYKGHGFENLSRGWSTPDDAFISWTKSHGHNEVMINQGTWTRPWRAVGAAMVDKEAVLWFGREGDQSIC